MTRYGTRGPNLPGMCSRLNCVKDKTHKVVVDNLGTQTATVNITIKVNAVPTDTGVCTVNGASAGGSVLVAAVVPLAPGATFSQDTSMTFVCAPASSQFIGQDYVLRAHVENISGTDPSPSNNDLVQTQTVK